MLFPVDAALEGIGSELGDLLTSFERHQGAIFCGAGISLRSGLPSASQLLEQIFDEIRLPAAQRRFLMASSLPFESYIHALSESTSIEPLLDLFTLGAPTTNHRFFAKLAAAGKVRTIATTNFDCLIEQALEAEGLRRDVDYVVVSQETELATSDDPADRVRVLKLHGTIDDLPTIAVTIEQVANRRSSTARAVAVRRLFGRDTRTVLVLGYSCSDLFDISPAIQQIGPQEAARVFLVDHGTDIARSEALGARREKNPFAAFPSGSRLSCDTDALVRELWVRLLSGATWNAEQNTTEWQARVRGWHDAAVARATNWIDPHIAGQFLVRTGHLKEALEPLLRALALAEALPAPGPLCTTLTNLAATYGDAGDRAKAADHYDRALQLAKRIGEWRSHIICLGNLAFGYIESGEFRRAIPLLEEAIALAQEKKDRGAQGSQTLKLGMARYGTGDLDGALASYQAALEIAESEGQVREVARILSAIGSVHERRYESPDAERFFRAAIAKARDVGDRAGLGTYLANLANAVGDQGRLAEAMPLYEQALVIADEIGDAHLKETATGNLGNAHHRAGNLTLARAHLSRALDLSAASGNRQARAMRLESMAAVLQDEGDLEGALRCTTESLAIQDSIGNTVGAGLAAGNVAGVLLQLGRHADAERHAERALRTLMPIFGAQHPAVDAFAATLRTARRARKQPTN